VVPEITDPASPRTPERISGHVEFRNVTFSYHGAEQPAVRDISFHAKPGEITAIIGGTGSGKSTIVNLIPRFYDPDSGEILVDGVNIREMTQNELRSRIGLVPQTAVLFTGTIEENIAFGTESLSRDRMEEAARISQSIEFIEAREAGYDERISQGVRTSPGDRNSGFRSPERWPVGPRIYIFDDSFSALDFRTDAKLRSALRSEIADGTVIIVAQRVSTVMNADRIIVLEDGKIVGVGKHKELMNSCEVYREIVSSQLSEEELV
jgi:ATP-binding cassette subfamily B protein